MLVELIICSNLGLESARHGCSEKTAGAGRLEHIGGPAQRENKSTLQFGQNFESGARIPAGSP
jgi:hypothetical protein